MCKELQFQNCTYGPFFYVSPKNNKFKLVSVYVDDLLIAVNFIPFAIQVKSAICPRFQMEDCGEKNSTCELKFQEIV